MLSTFAELRSAVIDQAGEDPDDAAGDFYQTVTRELVRVYREVLNRHPFLWARKDPPGVIATVAPFVTGTVQVTNGLDTAVLSSPPAVSLAGRKLVVSGEQDVYRILAHTAADPNLTLDLAWQGTSAAAATFGVYQDEYTLPSDAHHLDGLYVSDIAEPLDQIGEQELRRRWPIPAAASWPPTAYARVSFTRIRLAEFPDRAKRIDVHHTQIPGDISTGGTILLPEQYRQVLVDGALYFTHLIKDDSRSDAAGVLFGRGMEGLIADDNRLRLALRQSRTEPGPYDQ